MSNFKAFALAIKAQFAVMSKTELFTTVLDGQDVWDQYLDAFPAGENKLYRVRREFDGSYDRNVIRRIGNLVTIVDGKPVSIWDAPNLEYPFNEVAAVLSQRLKNATLTGIFRCKETKLGYVSTVEALKNGATKRWDHFHCDIAAKHRTDKVGEAVGEYNTKLGVYKRGLEELKLDAIDSVLSLIDSNALYRGQEFKDNVAGFRKLKAQYLASNGGVYTSIFLYNSFSSSPYAHTLIRNTVIGQLLQDLSEGKDLEAAVGAYEAMVAPTNYKRTTALITPRMVEEAQKKLDELGLESALHRRHAVIGDVAVNNVLWVNNEVKGLMKGGIAGMIGKLPTTVNTDKATDIPIETFLKDILPTVTSMEVLLKNPLVNNLVSITAPVEADAKRLFKWDNPFAWSYNGNIADSDMRKAVVARGGRVDGVFRFTHQWNYDKRNASLMDLHVFLPASNIKTLVTGRDYGNRERVGWNNRRHVASGGVQDVDYVEAAPVGFIPVENITFPELRRMPEGEYLCAIQNWAFRNPTLGGFRAEIEFEGEVFEYEYAKPIKNNEWVEVARVTLKNGKFTIKHSLPTGHTSQKIWGLDTQTFVKVNVLMNSPNYWDENKVGNKHWFFILEGCINDEPTRGFYNEFLRGEFEPQRKVFEVLGDKTKCEPSNKQLSGVGFSSTKREVVTVRASTTTRNSQLYNIQF